MSSLHIASKKEYFAVFGALMVLTAITVAVAFVDLGVFSDVVALGIAGVKATLVLLIFMHVRHSTRLVQLTSVAGFLWLAFLFLLLLSDYVSRGWLGVPGK